MSDYSSREKEGTRQEAEPTGNDSERCAFEEEGTHQEEEPTGDEKEATYREEEAPSPESTLRLGARVVRDTGPGIRLPCVTHRG